MADDKTTKTPEQPVTDSGPGKETPPAPPKEPEKVSVSPEPEKKTEPEVKNPQVSVYNFAEIMKEKKVEERAAAPSGEKPAPAKTEKPEKQPEAPKKAEEKPKEPEQPKRRGRPPKADKDKAATITTADESVFYLVIDKQKTSENVYFLNTVTTDDLGWPEKSNAGIVGML